MSTIQRSDPEYLQLKQSEAPDGCEIVLREPRALQLDIDSEYFPVQVKQRIKTLTSNGYVPLRAEWWRSRSGNLHVQIYFNRHITNEDAIFLQLFLGSDPVKEFLSLRRMKENPLEKPILLYRPKISVIEPFSLEAA